MEQDKVQFSFWLTPHRKQALRIIAAVDGDSSMAATLERLIDERATKLQQEQHPITTAYELQTQA